MSDSGTGAAGRGPLEIAADEVATPREVTWEILSERLNDLVVLADLSSTIFYVSPACSRLGYVQHDMIGQGPADFVHPDDLDHFLANTRALFAEGQRANRPLAEPAPAIISQTSGDGRFLYLSPSVERITGYTVNELMPRTM